MLVALSLASLLTTAGCLHIRLHTAIASNGGTVRSIELSADEKYRALLESTQESKGLTSSARDGWAERSYVQAGRFHRVLSKEFLDVVGIPDRELQRLFGHWIEPGAYQEGDAVEFDIYRTLPATSYSFRETFHIRPSTAALTEARQLPQPSVKVRIEVEMPGRLLESPAATRTDRGTAAWNFAITIEDTAAFAGQVTATSGRTHMWHYLVAGTLAILFLAFLPRQFRR